MLVLGHIKKLHTVVRKKFNAEDFMQKLFVVKFLYSWVASR